MKEFVKVLRGITDAAAAIQAGTFTDGDFVDFQRLEHEIITGRARLQLDALEGDALTSLYLCVKLRAREALGLDAIYERRTPQGNDKSGIELLKVTRNPRGKE